jgi:FkbM family methyltransferase
MDASVFYDGAWIHRLGRAYYVDGPAFNYYVDHAREWPQAARDLKRNSADYWFHAFSPHAGMVIVDVGAGIGTDVSIFSEAVGAHGKVVAIEAHPRTFSMLQTTCRWNHLENVTLVHAALMDATRDVFVEDQDQHEENAVSISPGNRHLPQPVRGVTLDALCDELGIDHIDFLKMNIEGAERLAIRGMERTIQRIDNVSIACHDFRTDARSEFRTRSEVIQFLERNGFRIVVRESDPRPYVRDHIHGVRQ